MRGPDYAAMGTREAFGRGQTQATRERANYITFQGCSIMAMQTTSILLIRRVVTARG